MRVEIFTSLPDCAKDIRVSVFMDEQGVVQEFDDLDELCTHLVMFDGQLAVATCRIWQTDDGWHVGRFAVIKRYRSRGLGQLLLEHAEQHVRLLKGNSLALHAQCRAESFYRKCGYSPFGEIDYDEGVEHVRMRKFLN